MKKIITCVFLLLNVFVFIGAYYLGFRQGRIAGEQSVAENFRINNFIASFDVLRKLRATNYSGAIERLESSCYSSFVDAIEGGGRNNLLNLYKTQLADYRTAYSNFKSDQYPTEQRLDLLLRGDLNDQKVKGSVRNGSLLTNDTN